MRRNAKVLGEKWLSKRKTEDQLWKLAEVGKRHKEAFLKRIGDGQVSDMEKWLYSFNLKLGNRQIKPKPKNCCL